MEQLERTRTNAANDSKGQAFGLSGNLFLFPIIGVVVALSVSMISFSIFGLGLVASILVAAPFLALPTIYVFTLRHNKPRGYDRDWLHNVTSSGFSFVKANQPINPRQIGGSYE
ncbi:hypothetical protein [Ruficoccus sp. ZRK36]|uniref:hypothetical protein n=1 Tax=Ruficoccus sp. ZRK36 TaxID=2866311 RepID=UPI001C734C47|nr:hypothetical protein [Ruficoccus sp. ZRK36]QYY35483.1 hypothetical protein K0V07_14440 [Ruficoccus sp. ZRK36]